MRLNNGQSRFKLAYRLVPYLKRPGISNFYASPILKARRGSLHGYDITAPTSLNPELGSEADLEGLAGALEDNYTGPYKLL